MSSGLSETAAQVDVTAAARVHVTLIDMNGSSGRLDGSVGFAVSDPLLRIALARRPEGSAGLSLPARVATEVAWAAERLGVPGEVDVRLTAGIPAHRGFGSGTQLRLALLRGLATLYGMDLDDAALFRASGRGGASGIGLHCFLRGGVIVDGGHSAAAKPEFRPSRFAAAVTAPPLLFAARPPEGWGVLLAMPTSASGLAGPAELSFMKANTPIPLREVQEVAHIVLMGLIPALVERDLAAFGRSLTLLQDVGWKRRHWARPDLAPWRPLLDAVLASGAAGGGLSSTGPLVYGVFDRATTSDAAVTARLRAEAACRGLPLRSVHTADFGRPAVITTQGAARK